MSRGLMILNVILIIQYSVFREQFQGSTLIHQLPAVLVLLNLYYHICNLQPGIILPERVFVLNIFDGEWFVISLFFQFYPSVYGSFSALKAYLPTSSFHLQPV